MQDADEILAIELGDKENEAELELGWSWEGEAPAQGPLGVG